MPIRKKAVDFPDHFGSSSESIVMVFSDVGNGNRYFILPEMLNIIAIMEQRKTAILRIATKNPLICRIEYEHLSDLTT
jgi:hypothetical protein